MGALSFGSFAQGPLGEAIRATETFGNLDVPVFQPTVDLLRPDGGTEPVPGPAIRLLGPDHIAGLVGTAVVRTDPVNGAVDVEPNYLATVELTPKELPWLLTPARPANGRLRPWVVLVVLDEATAPVEDGVPLPSVEAPVAQLPDLRDSWGWAHVQRSSGGDIARLICPRRLDAHVTYRACLVPAFDSGCAAGLGVPHPDGAPHAPAWSVDAGGTVRLPLYYHWTFTTGTSGDFEELVGRLQPADPESLRVAASRPVDVRAPWPDDTALSESAQVVGVSGALVPFTEPPPPAEAATPEVLAALDARLAEQLDAPAALVAGDGSRTVLAPPTYGARHVLAQRLGEGPAWVSSLNLNVANRLAAGLGTAYVRDHQEDLMAKAWEQVGQVRDASLLRNVVELSTEVSASVHRRHVETLTPGETLALAAPAQARTRTSDATTLALEMRVSRLTNGAMSSSFRRVLRPAGKLARRSGTSAGQVIQRGLTGDVTTPVVEQVIPEPPALGDAMVPTVAATAAVDQVMVMTAMASVASLADAGGADTMSNQLAQLGDLAVQVNSLAVAGDAFALHEAITPELAMVTDVTASIVGEMSQAGGFGTLDKAGVTIEPNAVSTRVADALAPGESHWARLASRLRMPGETPASAPIVTCPDFPVPTALALLESDPEWFLPGLGAMPTNRVAMLRQNSAFIESFLVGINHELMRELLWREYPTDQRGTPFRCFWPRPGQEPDIAPIHTWTDPAALGDRLLLDEALVVVLVRGDVVRRYPGMIVTAVRSDPPVDGRYRPGAGDPTTPIFVISVDAETNAYAFEIPEAELSAPATAEAPGWFFVLAEPGFRVRFGFDTVPPAALTSWNDATWPAGDDASGQGPLVPVVRGHAVAGLPFGPPAQPGDGALWNRDAADIARIVLQRPVRVAVQAEVLLLGKEGV